MDMDIEKRLANLTPFAREQADSTWLGGTPKQDWLAVGLLLETLDELLERVCERESRGRALHVALSYSIGSSSEGEVFARVDDWDSCDFFWRSEGTRVDALVDLVNQVAAHLEPTDQEKRDDAEVSATC